MTEPADEPIKRSTLLQVGDHDGRYVVAISMVVSKGEASRSKAISGAVYDDIGDAWKAVREFANARILDGVEERIERPAKVAPAPPVASPDDPF